ncbi:histone-lysine N-methyltransferase SETMAR [Nephila pilipes]|uniref:Histone-lysine N-methyltransferase SETMAR n=1 Tax=Nephila pilipes TaxID=299642 RepID=A0A8X6PGJ9_NEPPI|nr:histone-lysine N-methyltransferase SETMAR [Nephila pilipes]
MKLYNNWKEVQQSLQRKEPALVNRKGILILHDNARPHVTRVVRDTIQRLDCDTLCHPPHSPDLAQSDYPLFHFLDNHLCGNFFTNEADLRQPFTDSQGTLKLTKMSNKNVLPDFNYVVQ